MLAPAALAFNRTRGAYLATRLSIADNHWTRFRGLMGIESAAFPAGSGLWILPSRGVHTFVMRFPIDVAYLDKRKTIIYLAHSLKPWRMAPVNIKSHSVLELPGNTLKATGTAVGDEIEILFGTNTQPGPA